MEEVVSSFFGFRHKLCHANMSVIDNGAACCQRDEVEGRESVHSAWRLSEYP